MNERTRNVIVGITSLLGLAGLGALLVMFGYVPKWMDSGYAVYVDLPEGGGLSKGSRVKLSGIDIGEVRLVEFQLLPKRGVTAVLHISEDARIPRDAKIAVNQPLLTGSTTLQISTKELSDEQLRDLLPTDGSARIVGTVPTVMGNMRRPLESLRKELSKPIEQFARMEQRFNELADTWTQVGQNITALTAARTLDQVDRGEAPANLVTVLARADQRIAEMKQVLEIARNWLDSMEQTAQRFNKAAEGISKTAEGIDKTAADAREQFRALAQRYVALADDLSAMISDTRRIVQKASDGDGTMGKLLNDPALYENLNDSAQRIGQAMDEIKLMIQKWNAEGVPLQF